LTHDDIRQEASSAMAVFLITDEILLLVLRLVEPDITEVQSQ
jgi:hypothetical protein